MTYVGFVVNMFNPLNYDIDILNLPAPIGSLQYEYADEDGIIKKGKTQRCRLAGILRKKSPAPHEEYMQSFRAISMQINRLNGWILVKIHGQDKYHRLLVELFDPLTGQSINEQLKKLKNVYIPYG